MSGSKANKLRGEWTEAKIEMAKWLKVSMKELEPAKKASDVKDMIAAAKAIDEIIGKTRPDNDDAYKLEQPSVERASREIGRAIKRVGDKMSSISEGNIFGEEEETADDEA